MAVRKALHCKSRQGELIDTGTNEVHVRRNARGTSVAGPEVQDQDHCQRSQGDRVHRRRQELEASK